jgi:hypothetical protein
MRSSIVPDSSAFLLGFFIQLQKAGTQSEPACEIEEFPYIMRNRTSANAKKRAF